MRILLAEDDELLGSGIRAGLAQNGFQVDWVRDGVAAERELATGAYQAAVLDLGLPRQDGMEVLRQVRARRRKNQALPMLTGRVQGPGPDLAKHNHRALAALVLACVLGFWAWQWDQAPELPAADATRWSENHHDDDD